MSTSTQSNPDAKKLSVANAIAVGQVCVTGGVFAVVGLTFTLFSSKSLFLKSRTDWDKERSFGSRYTEWNQKTASKIQDGVLAFHYSVLESTNTLGRTFPTKFEFFQAGRQYEQDGNWFCQGVGLVKTIRASTEPPTLK